MNCEKTQTSVTITKPSSAILAWQISAWLQWVICKVKVPPSLAAELNEAERKMVHESGAQRPGPGVGLEWSDH